MKASTLDALARWCGNARMQGLLARGMLYCQYLMGIGSGGATETSGERALIEPLRRIAAGGRAPRVFDVGANQGQFARLLAGEMAGLPLELHAFEPARASYEALSRNAAGIAGAVLNQCGLGAAAGEFTLYYDRPGSGLASLSKRSLAHAGIAFEASEPVRLDTLDAYCAARGIETIDLLKIDVEGHELDVLHGGEGLFARRAVAMVSFEFGGCNIDTRTYFRDFHAFFTARGLRRLFRLTPAGFLVPIGRYQEIHEQFRTTNFLALRDEPDDED